LLKKFDIKMERTSILYFNINGKITVLKEKGGIHIFNYNSREVCVYFKTRGGVCVI
jgi:hypothetical protein